MKLLFTGQKFNQLLMVQPTTKPAKSGRLKMPNDLMYKSATPMKAMTVTHAGNKIKCSERAICNSSIFAKI